MTPKEIVLICSFILSGCNGQKDDHGKVLTVFISSKTISMSDLHQIVITCELILYKILFDAPQKSTACSQSYF